MNNHRNQKHVDRRFFAPKSLKEQLEEFKTDAIKDEHKWALVEKRAVGEVFDLGEVVRSKVDILEMYDGRGIVKM